MLDNFADRIEAQVQRDFEGVQTMADYFDRLRDLPSLCEPKPYPSTSIVWPPAYHSAQDCPPPMNCLVGSFTVEASPDLMNKAYSNFVNGSAERLDKALSEREKLSLQSKEVSRLISAWRHAIGWTDDDSTAGYVDKGLYGDLCFVQDHPLHAQYFPTTDIEAYKNDGVTPLRFGIVAFRYPSAPILIAFCHVRHLDVVQEIQEIARIGVQVVPGEFDSNKVKSRPAIWPNSVNDTPAFRKAKNLLQWAFHTAFEYNTKHVQISDGWYHIWLHIFNGVIRVGPTMEATIYSDETKTLPLPNGQLSLCKAFLAVTHQATKDKLANLQNKNVVILEAEVEMAYSLREGLDGRMTGDERRIPVRADANQPQESDKATDVQEKQVSRGANKTKSGGKRAGKLVSKRPKSSKVTKLGPRSHASRGRGNSHDYTAVPLPRHKKPWPSSSDTASPPKGYLLFLSDNGETVEYPDPHAEIRDRRVVERYKTKATEKKDLEARDHWHTKAPSQYTSSARHK